MRSSSLDTITDTTPLRQSAEELARRVAAVSDQAMRPTFVRHELQALGPERSAGLLEVVLSMALTRTPEYLDLVLFSSVALTQESAKMRLDIAEAASQIPDSLVEQWLADDRSPRETSDRPPPNRVPLSAGGRPLTLGERKALARRPDRGRLEHALRDMSPDVIEVLLRNPSLTEDEVVRVAARRPNQPENLTTIFRSARWAVRYRVRGAIIRNPACPTFIGVSIAYLLRDEDARAVAKQKQQPIRVRQACLNRFRAIH